MNFQLYGRGYSTKTFGLFEYDNQFKPFGPLNKELTKQLGVGTGEVRAHINGTKVETGLSK